MALCLAVEVHFASGIQNRLAIDAFGDDRFNRVQARVIDQGQA